jgi:hypothetical protein
VVPDQVILVFNPLILAPGQSGVIHLYIQPDPAKIGKTVSGDVFIDTFNFVQFNGDELARISLSISCRPMTFGAG